MFRKALIVVAIVLVGLAGYASTFVISYDRILHPPEKGRLADVGRLESAAVRGVVRPRKVEELVALVKEARGVTSFMTAPSSSTCATSTRCWRSTPLGR